MGFPTDWTLANFAEAFKNFTVKVPSGTGSVTYNVWGMLLWSAIYAVGGAIIQAMSCALVAYAVARFNKFKISKVLYSIVIITYNFNMRIQTSITLHSFQDSKSYSQNKTGYEN